MTANKGSELLDSYLFNKYLNTPRAVSSESARKSKACSVFLELVVKYNTDKYHTVKVHNRNIEMT